MTNRKKNETIRKLLKFTLINSFLCSAYDYVTTPKDMRNASSQNDKSLLENLEYTLDTVCSLFRKIKTTHLTNINDYTLNFGYFISVFL